MNRLVSVAAILVFGFPCLATPPTTKPDASQTAVEAAKAKLSGAAADAEKAWELTTECKALKADLETKRMALEAARAGSDAKAKLDASATYNAARLKLEKATSAAIAGDAKVIAATDDLRQVIAAAAEAEKARLAARKALVPKSTFYSRATAMQADQKELSRAAGIDEKILDYLEKNKVSPPIAAALWAGKPMVGMSEAEVGLLGWVEITGGTGDRKFGTLYFALKDSMGRSFCRVSIQDGKVVQFSY